MIQRMARRMTYHGAGRTEEEAAEAKRALKRADIPVIEMEGVETLTGPGVDNELKARLNTMLELCYEMNGVLIATAGGAVPETFSNYFRDQLFTLVSELDDLRDGLETQTSTIGGFLVQIARNGSDPRKGRLELRPRE